MDVKFLTVISLLIAFSGSNAISEIIVNYFMVRNVKFVCLFHCYNGISPVNMAKTFSNESIGFSSVNLIDKENIDSMLCFKSPSSLGVILDVSCEGSADVLNYASHNLHFDANTKWLLIKPENDNKFEQFDNNDSITIDVISSNNRTENDNNFGMNNEIMEILDNLNLSVDADIKVLRKEHSDFVLYDVFNYGKVQGGRLVIEDIGTWNISSGFSCDFSKFKYYKRWNFQDLALRMIIVVSPEAVSFDAKVLKSRDTTPIPGVVTIIQTSSIILHEIADQHNLRFKYTITDRWIGSFDKNSTRVVANSLYFREQDISPLIRYLSFLSDKFGVIHPPVTSIETRYYYRIPTKGPGKFENQFLRPLSKGAWFCFTAVSILCSFLLMLSAGFERRPSMVQYAVFSVVASVCQQFFQDSDDIEGRRVSSSRKLTILVTGISCVLIYNYYTSSVVSWLLNGPPPSINSLKELLESPLELIYEDVGYTRSWLQNPSYYYNKRNAKIEDEIRQKKVLNKKPGAPLLKSVEEGIALVKAGGYAYHTEVSSANNLISKTFTQTELCELGSLQSIERTYVYSCVQKQSPYKEFFDWSLMRFRERGIINRIQSRMDSYQLSCAGSSPRALALGGAAPAFILLGSGFILASFIMVVERIKNKIINKIKNANKNEGPFQFASKRENKF